MSTQDGELTIHPFVQNVGGGYPGGADERAGVGGGGEKPDSLPNYSPSLGQGSPWWTLMCREGLKRRGCLVSGLLFHWLAGCG